MSTNFASNSTLPPLPNHTFLMQNGRWQLNGHYLMHREGVCIPVQGKVMVAWNSDDWFNLVGKLTRPSLPEANGDTTNITFQYRGHTTTETRQQYTFVLQHSQYGQTEGEGWLMPDSIVQRFWILGDREQRIGLERFYRINADRYIWSSTIMTGHSLISTLDATLERFK